MRPSYNMWSKEMTKDFFTLYPYMRSDYIAKVLNKKYGTKLTVHSVNNKSMELNCKKELFDEVTIEEACQILEGITSRSLRYIVNKRKIGSKNASGKIVLSLKDLDKIKKEYYIELEDRISMKDACENYFLSKSVINDRLVKMYNMKKLSICENGTSKRISYLSRKEMDMVMDAERENKKFCIIRPISPEKDSGVYLTVSDVAQLLGVQKKLVSVRCGDITKIHPDIKYIYRGNACMPTAQIPMRAIESIFDKLNEGWSYKNY